MKNICGIYMLKNTVDGKVYVGQSIHTWRRWHEHKKSAKRGDKSYLYDAMRRHDLEVFKFTILEACDPLQLDIREDYWITFYDARNPEKGYNYMPAGQRGRVMDAATREKMSARLRGTKLKPETVEKIRQANTGRKHSTETKQKIAHALLGKTVPRNVVEQQAEKCRLLWAAKTPEEKEAHAAARRGYKHTAEARARISQVHKGKKKSEETRAKMREALRNEPAEVRERRLSALREVTIRRWAAYRAEKAKCL